MLQTDVKIPPSLGIHFGNSQDGDCRIGQHDDERRAMAISNRQKLMHGFKLSAERLVTPAPYLPDNIHVLTRIPETPDQRPNTECIVTRLPGVAIGVQANDCMPVLLADHENGVIAACHVGRKTLRQPFLTSVIETMQALGADNIDAYIGPCLQQGSHDVDATERNLFLRDRKDAASYFHQKDGSEKFSFDFSGYAGHLLAKEDVRVAFRSTNDTYSDHRYFSYRRRHLDNNEGLNLSFIALKPDA